MRLCSIPKLHRRDDLESLKEQLKSLGATEVLTYDDLNDKSFRERVKGITGGKVRLCLNPSRSHLIFLPCQPIRLLLNCVSGPATTQMLKPLGSDAHLVSYGAMSKQPLSLPTSAFIFKNLVCHGFWQSRWYQQHSRQEREALMKRLADMNVRDTSPFVEHSSLLECMYS